MRVAARLGRLESPGFIRGERFNVWEHCFSWDGGFYGRCGHGL
ncbi:hypothetical protein ACFPOI_02635 [Nonomuraea angiospora]|uniref:Uncharacterized protein n=1 Tax=Nonomuraea angiospora TaxID=46172 RepID=A0ABR9M439_9ACTN|nr:hypothetical protein [Nonomuraea angiospora]MBE1587308.1 hypothetical protein [Nonomuraea angiospora]